MTWMISGVMWVTCGILAVLLLWFSLEILLGLKDLPSAPGTPLDDLVLIVPAHDEALGLGAMLRDLPTALSRDRVLVVADNCSDDTGAIARAAGVNVVERIDPDRRGKGYALAFARAFLAERPPAAVMVLDADCRIACGDPRILASRAAAEGAAVQSENLQTAASGSSLMLQIGAFAFLIKNLVRARGLERLSGSTILQGTGMVFPWAIFASLKLETGNAVEDIDLTAQLAKSGVPVRLDRRCRITSQAGSATAHLEQRKRWEQGFLLHGTRFAVPLLAAGMARGSRRMFALGAHMLVPPLAFLLLLSIAAGAVASLLAATGAASWWPPLTMAAAGVLAAISVVAGWLRQGRQVLGFRALLLAPAYALWKLPLYLGLPFRRGVAWTRTERASASPGEDDG